MIYYHPTKEAAQAVANELAQDPRVAMATVQLEPYNGWVVVLVPHPQDLSDLADRAEIQDGKRRPPPVAKQKAKPIASAQTRGAGRESVPTLKVDPNKMSIKPAWLK